MGSHTVTANAGCSSQTVVILVQDTNPPSLTRSGFSVCTDSKQCYATITNLHAHVTTNDNSGPVTLEFDPPGPHFPKGATEVTATATDAAGNSTHCTFNVDVYDCEAPRITCPGDIVVCASPTGTNIVTWPTPSASDNCAVTSVSCYPPSNSDFPVGQTTVYCIATDSSGNQDTCSFTVTVVQVDVTNIKFNHNTSSSASDALNLRQDYSTAYDISNGEWIQGGANLPVCYTTNKSVTIKVRLTVQPASITRADIWAVSTGATGALGDVTKTTVTFSGGVSSPEYVTFSLANNTPTTIKKTTSDVWQWKMENINGHGSAACDANVSGPHTVYTILAEPTPPWVNTWGSQKNAWTKALDFAIVSASCNGDSTASNALSHIAQYLHAGHGFTYDINGGRPKYASSNLGGTMDLTGYIDKSSQLYGTEGNVINCYDQASGVCTFGRLLGVSVTYRYMSPFGYINTVNLVGEGSCNNPFYPLTTGGKVTGADEVAPVRSRFGNHAFTLLDGYVFDACAGPHLGTRTEAQYVSDTVDSSTPAEAAVAGDTSNISSGAVTDLK